MKTLIVTIIIFLSSLQIVYSQWEQIGPPGSKVYCVAANDSNIFAGTSKYGVFHSTNNGQSWIQTSLNDESVYSLAINGSNIFAGCFADGVFLSTNNGHSWTQTALNNQVIECLAVDGSKVFAGTLNSGVYLSTDNGTSWTQTSLHPNILPYSLAISGSNIFAGTTYGVYLSTDNGQNWERTSLKYPPVHSIVINGSNIFAGTFKPKHYNAKGVYLSTDNGQSWTQTALNDKSIYSLSISGSNLYAATKFYGVFLSTDNGQSWTQTALNDTTVYSLAISGSNVFAAPVKLGVFISTNYGQNWTQTALYNEDIYSITMSGSNIIAGTYDYSASAKGVYLSTNNGLSWIHSSLDDKTVFSLTASSSHVFAGTYNSGVYISTNNGYNWTQTSLNDKTVYSLVISGTNIFAGTQYSGVYISANNGQSWVQTALNNNTINSLTAIGSNIFAGTWYNGVYLSTNNGQDWTQTSLNNNALVYSLVVSGSNIFAGTHGGGEDIVYLSSDTGKSWIETSMNDKSVYALAASGSIVFAGCYHNPPYHFGGIYLSTNNGTNWIQKNEGMGFKDIRSLYISNDYIYAGTYGFSAWKRRLSEIISGNHDFSAGPFIDFPEVFIKDSSYHVKARITNEGREPETNVPIRFLINGTQVGYYLRSLPAGGIDTVDFTWAPNNAGDFNVAIVSALPTDINRANDTVKADVRVYSSSALPIFCDDFSGGTVNWTITNDGGSCVWQTYSPPYPNVYSLPATSSGSVLSADADECGSGTSLLSTATIIENVDCSLFENVYLEFDNDWNAIDEQDSAIVDVSYDGGTNWSSVIAWGGTDVRNTQEIRALPGADANPNVRIRFRSIQPGWDWWWAVDNVCIKGFPLTGLTQNSGEIPTKYALMQNYPNPFNPSTKIRFDLPKSTQAKLIIYDILGREVATLVNEKLGAGSYEVSWQASSYPSGVYFYKLVTNNFVDIKKMLLIK